MINFRSFLRIFSFAFASLAQLHADDTLSAVINGAADPVDPATAFSEYGTAQTARSATDARLQALARALDYDPDRIYEHVRNHIEFTPTFGLSKGSVGAMLDEAGTAFDQAQLMVDLLRADNPDIAGDQSTPAKYKVGKLTLDGAEFDAWFGITDAEAACRTLADGGVPAQVNGSTNCSSLSGSVSTVTLAHIWVEAETALGARYFDPARKEYDEIAGVGLSSLKTEMGFSASTFNSTASASTGTTSGVSWASNINYAGVESYLGDRADALIDYLKTDHPDASLEEIVGGRRLVPVYGDDLGWSSLPSEYQNVGDGWHSTTDEIPDDYRTNVSIYVHGCGDGQTSNCPNFTYDAFADELAGRRVMLGSMEAGWGGEGQADVHLFIDGESVASIARPLIQLDPVCKTTGQGIGKFIPGGGAVDVEITVDAPYAADNGDYMDRVYDTLVELDSPAVLIAEFGDRRAGKGYDSTSEQHHEWIYPYEPAQFYLNFDKINPQTWPGSWLPTTGGDKQRLQIAKSYFDQLAQLRRIVEGLFEMRAHHHYSIGLVWSRTQEYTALHPTVFDPNAHHCQPVAADAATSIDIVSGISANALDGDDEASKRAAHLIISAGAMLEGSVGEQATDNPVVLNTQSRFKWASENVSGEKFYLVTSSNFAAAESLIEDELYVEPYTDAGYSVLVPASTDLGPGPDTGVKYFTSCTNSGGGGCIPTYRPSNYRGGALAAFDAGSGSAAYMVQAGDGFTGNKWLKGGGVTEEYDEFDPTELPEVMEEDYGLRAGLVDGVSLQNGQLTYQPAPDLVTGSGSFPYSLAFQRKFKAGQTRSRGLTHGWTHNWDMRASFGGDGMEALGATNPQNAAAAISAMVAADSILDATWDARRMLALQIIENWQREKMAYNTVTLIQGNDTIAFFRLPDGSFNPPAGQTGALAQSGTRKVYYPAGNADCPQDITPVIDNKTGSWWYGDVTLTYTSAMGDKQVFEHFTWEGAPYDAFHTSAVNRCNTGHRITSWAFGQGVTLSFSYHPDDTSGRGRLESVSNGLGRSLDFTYVGALSAEMSVAAGDGREVAIEPDETTRADGTVMKYDYSTPTTLFYADSVDWSDGRPMPWPQLTKVYAASDHATAHLTIAYDEAWRVKSVTDKNANAWSFRIAGSRGSVVDPLGHETASYFDDKGREARSVSPLGDITEKDYNGIGLPIEERAYFVGGVCSDADDYDAKSETTYDTQWWAPSSQKQYSAQCESGAALTTSTDYRSDYPLPSSETDARGETTDYEYVSKSHGGATTKLLSAVEGPSGERTEFTYGGAGAGRPTQKKVKVSSSTWETTDYGWTGEHLTSRTLDPGGVGATTLFGYNDAGDATSVTDPNSNVTTIDYDDMRRVAKVTRPAGAITQLKYDDDGKVLKRCDALAFSPGDCDTSPTKWAATAYAYTPTFKVAAVTDPDGYVTDYAYTARDEVDRVTRWLDLAETDSRVEQTVYDAAGQVVEIKRAVGTALEQIYRKAAYHGASGLLDHLEDANGNRTTYEYDAYGRLAKTRFPDKTTAGVSSTTDYETYTYDENGNMLTKRARDGRVISYVYDASNRLTTRTVPGSGSDPGVNEDYTFTYDLAGRQTSNHHYGITIEFDFDGAGRVVSKTHDDEMEIAYEYDAAGNLTRLTHPDGYDVDFTYDALNRVETAEEGARTLASVTYDKLSRRKSVTYDNGTSASYDYTPRSDLTDHDWSFAGSAAADYDFTYNGVGQLLTESVSDAALRWQPEQTSVDAYAVNGLNQYTSVAWSSPVHDANGNVTTDHRGRTYEYDAENVLTQAMEAGTGSNLGTYVYYGDGTMRLSYSATGPTARHYYDGDQEILETDDGWLDEGIVTRRYVRLPGSVDEPFLMIDYTGSCGSGGCERWAHQNRLGSVVAVTDESGAVVERHIYAPYGESGGDDAGFPFRFTGQKLDPETGLYYYKARWYDPEVGRFMQTDPIGYEGGMNIYAYAYNDPINRRDPTGLRPPDNTDPEKDQSTRDMEMVETLIEAGEATEIFIEEKKALEETARTRAGDPSAHGADKDHHCRANCEATKLGETGEATAKALSDAKEAHDRATGRNTEEESADDQRANRAGREAGRRGDSCSATCEQYVRENENPDYVASPDEDER